jgi:competence protein ComEC
VSCGLWRGGISQIARHDYQQYYGQTVQLHGRVVEDVSYGKQGDMRLRINSVRLGDKPLTGEVWISTLSKVDVDRSDTVIVSGKMSEGFGNLPATMKRATLVSRERPQPGDVALHVRDWFAGGIRKAIPDPQASLGAGYLTGQRSSLPASLDQELKIAGLTHIVVASGYNLTILVGFARRALQKLSRYLATMTAVAMVCGFVLVTGFSPSMSRAGLVTLMSLAAWYYGRTVHPLVILPLAAAITALINPAYVWGDMGWYLSFGSFAGVLLLAPLIHHYFWSGEDEPGVVRGILVETSSAQLATMPIILFAFGQYSVYALAANMIILPFIPLTMVLTFFAGVGGLAFPAIASWIGLPATAVLTYMTTAVHWVANLPAAQGHITFSATALAISYLAIALSIVFMWRRTRYQFRSVQTTNQLIGEKA